MANYHKLTEEEKEFILKEYAEGWSSNKIAEKIGCGRQTVLNHLNKMGISPSKSKSRSSNKEDTFGSKNTRVLPSKEEILHRYIYLKDEGRLLNKVTLKYTKEGSRGYRESSFASRDSVTRYLEHRLIYFLEIGEQQEQIDHIDGDRANNRISNLRAATTSQNQSNREGKRGSASKYKGVHKSKSKKSPWRVVIVVNGEGIYLGAFSNENEAAKVYNDAAIKYFGEFAYLNKIEEN